MVHRRERVMLRMGLFAVTLMVTLLPTSVPAQFPVCLNSPGTSDLGVVISRFSVKTDGASEVTKAVIRLTVFIDVVPSEPFLVGFFASPRAMEPNIDDYRLLTSFEVVPDDFVQVDDCRHETSVKVNLLTDIADEAQLLAGDFITVVPDWGNRVQDSDPANDLDIKILALAGGFSETVQGIVQTQQALCPDDPGALDTNCFTLIHDRFHALAPDVMPPDDTPEDSTLPDSPPPSDTIVCAPGGDAVTYQVTFASTWSEETHPTNFPAGAHFSGLIGATHKSDVTFWQPGSLASPGIENMAERGSKSPLNAEIAGAIVNSTAGTEISGGGIAPSPGSASVIFKATPEFSLVSLVSMLAPSPDWFVGVHNLDLCDSNAWVGTINVTLFPYDAGTDSGERYESPNSATNPSQPISRITTGVLALDGQETPVGTFTFVRQ